MCGIAGIFHYAEPARNVDARLVAAMTRSLAHRGPDGEGLHVAGPIGLGHRRLAIVDLTPTGAQPMQTPCGRACITYNGEFYNHHPFRARLAARGAVFHGTSDTETMLLALQAWGPGFLEDVAGIFALAFWDGGRRRLLLARDPLGVKPLYYHDDGRRIAFASEIKALLLVPGVDRAIDPEALNQYLHFHAPLHERTFFRGVRQVLPAEYVEVDRHGLRRKTYWQPTGFAGRSGSPAQQVDELRHELTTVVADQLLSDVQVGCFFSAGIDSSAVAAFARRHTPRLPAFGLHFSGQGVIDERPFQERAAAALGLDLELVTLDGATFPGDMPRLTFFQDQPMIGAALIPMYHVSRLAARRVKVCLGGQGGDEVFGGYARYALVRPTRALAAWLGPRAQSNNGTGQRVGGNLWKQVRDPRNLRRLGSAALRGTDWRSRYFHTLASVPARHWRALFPESSCFSPERARLAFDDGLNRSPARDPRDKVLHWDVQTYLPGLFHQDDRMSMASGLESRVPLADPRLVRFAFHTPFDLKVRAGASKWILRQALADVLPAVVLNRRKVGFDTPAERWMRGPHAPFVRETLLSARARARGFWDARALERVLDDGAAAHWFDVVWKLLSIEVWAGVFLDAPALQRPGESLVA